MYIFLGRSDERWGGGLHWAGGEQEGWKGNGRTCGNLFGRPCKPQRASPVSLRWYRGLVCLPKVEQKGRCLTAEYDT